MKILSPLPTVVSLLLAVNAADAAACKALIDSSSTLTASLAAWTGADPSSVPFASVFEELGAALPSLSKCAAVFDPIAAYVSLAASVKSCLSALESVDSVDEDLTTAAGWANVCPIVEDTVLPCITAAMKESIMGTLFSAGDCCEDFLDEVHTRFGDSLDIMVEKLAQHLANAACAERTFTSLAGALTKERCGYSILNSYSFINQEHGYETPSLLNIAQIPNDQMSAHLQAKTSRTPRGARLTRIRLLWR